MVKAVSPDENGERGDNPDQVALESVDQDGAQSLHFQQHPSQHGPLQHGPPQHGPPQLGPPQHGPPLSRSKF